MIEKDIIKAILEYAIRAPSTHNSQPWLFKIEGDKVHIFFDKKYVLPFVDKENRDLHISIGCMLENLRIAALNSNFYTHFSYGPFNNETKLAEAALNPGNVSDLEKDLFNAIPGRVNARGLFIQEDIPPDLINKINALCLAPDLTVSYITDKNNIKAIARLTREAIKEAYNQKEFRKEMSHWMNSNLSLKKEGLPGYALKMPFFVSLIIPILIRYFNIGFLIANKSAQALSSAPLIIVISGPDDKNSRLKVGMLAERIMLYLQSLKYQTSIYVGAVEIGGRYASIQKIAQTEHRPQFVFAVGHIPGKHRLTPRHKLAEKIIP
ncbi:hypothetical protein A3G06_00560 [Candidatus Nomurabacteria bacterium RIFCSPLOWO2_12_FULL_46_14]|uniref:Nitroreductase domain-containing protein n=1 Tax=Candidatus Nomurabacteria bacterium RIFCSPLOWO2_12_FULL_46_14 TaxID=1801797 RepID=A0A1F6Y9R3_9BACT|nr:MAG: hypothetical protein A3G06_00560 [Candidatus Nomurabacteria bacterium RIFCSPLOWO2_12_FULL_46_14]